MREYKRPDLELYVRSLGPDVATEDREAVIERLQRLDGEDAIGSYQVRIYGSGLLPKSASARTGVGMKLSHRLFVLKQWAAVNNGDHRHFVVTRDREVGTDPRTHSYVFPQMVLLEYDSTRLQFGTPFEKANRRYTIEEHLDALDPGSRTVLPARQTAVGIEDPVRTGQRNVPVDQRSPSPQRP